jgi:hypothetical protein
MSDIGRLAVLGAGKMGEALIRGLLDAGTVTADRVLVVTGSGDGPGRSPSSWECGPPSRTPWPYARPTSSCWP